ncbi:hypothetical protein BBBOND_0106600 [Babesia bigemina]|uniref:Uncharacterized protein n=1 Tax=Babesia bigemina TaxID=5866 RepID=A0A061D0M8_BABBI|nr:hypothetical protein BBBOND_0106600 [Babesia bigemina]CDR94351.1 hypothetical protein BBBOND_0106600 [Babesia bigemina]|eukprot:XP_012766537.1 hypothetical protein BBBOND_0106600 [Babesia bigemina]
MMYLSLTRAPRDLKEAIDWLVALKGDDPKNNLRAISDAIYNLLESDTLGLKMLPALKIIRRISQRFLQKQELQDQVFVRASARKMNKLVDKTPGGVNVPKNVTPETIANNVTHVVVGAEIFLNDIKDLDEYKSAYSSEATWSNSCSTKPEACAVIFVGIAPILFAGLRYVRDASLAAKLPISKYTGRGRLDDIMKSLGYKDTQYKERITRSDILTALRAVDHQTMATLHDLASI